MRILMAGPMRILIVALTLLLAGCFGGRSPESRHYLLDYIPRISAERLQQGPYPLTLRLRELDVAEAYRRPQLVYRRSPHELQYYNYQLWAIPPERQVTELIHRHLEAAKLFKLVSTQVEQWEPDLVMDGMLEAIEEYDNDDNWYGHLALTLMLRDPTRGADPLWSRRFDFRTPVEVQEPVQVVRTLSAIVEGCVNQALVELEPILAQEATRKLRGGRAIAPVEPPPAAPRAVAP